MEIDKNLYAEIKEYCDLNGLKVRQYIESILKKAFMEDKYGKCPPMFKKPTQTVVAQPSEPISEEKTPRKEAEICGQAPKLVEKAPIVELTKEIEKKEDIKTVTSKTKKRTLN